MAGSAGAPPLADSVRPGRGLAMSRGPADRGTLRRYTLLVSEDCGNIKKGFQLWDGEERFSMLTVGSIVLRVDDLRRQAEFWAAALGYVPREDSSNEGFVFLRPKDGNGPNLSLDLVRSELHIPHASTWTCMPTIKPAK